MSKKFWGASALETGEYKPTITNQVNIASIYAYDALYVKVGDIVTIAGRLDIDTTTTGVLTSFNISLPFNTNFTGVEDCGGSMVNAYNDCFVVEASISDDNVLARARPVNTAVTAFSFSIQYRII